MRPEKRAELTAKLRRYVEQTAGDIRTKIRQGGIARERAQRLHEEEKAGEDFEVWTDLLSRRAAVLWVLKAVYVRVLEDRKLLKPVRIADGMSEQLFEKLAPHLGETAYLRWIYRDLASRVGGLPELFSPQAAEVAEPSNEHSRGLIAFFRHKDADTGTQYEFGEEHFDGELMGDLYQELDPLVKERFALCQTPEFVRTFMLDRTLGAAIAEYGADRVRVLDPACGSGHFLIDALKKLTGALIMQHPDWEKRRVVEHALERVVGIDLNDYACGLARARLVMTAAELSGAEDLAEAGRFHPRVYWADGLEQVEKEGSGEQMGLFEGKKEKISAELSRGDTREELRKVFEGGFEVVVANPPYITEKDSARKDYHREKVGKGQRYISAYREYSLASPFAERCFQLARPGGYVGMITSNNFMKREFGKPLIEKVLGGIDLTLVVDTSQAYIPYHGTPTVILIGRNRKPVGPSIRAVMGKRGESGTPSEPAKGKVWMSIVEGVDRVGFENEYVSVAEVGREVFKKHPWSLGGGGAAELKERIEQGAPVRLGTVASEIGFICMTRADEIYFTPKAALKRAGVPDEFISITVEGDKVRDWGIHEPNTTLFPYNGKLEPVSEAQAPSVHRFLWPYRALLWLRREPNGNHREIGLTWWEWSRFQRNRFRTPLSIAFAFVATHNHFVLDRGGKVFKQSAPIIKLPAGASEDEHLALLGLLNSSTACFWMKQVFHAKGGVDRCQVEAWDMHFEFDSTKIKLFPIPKDHPNTLPYANTLDQLAQQRTQRSIASLLADPTLSSDPATLRKALNTRKQQDLLDLQRMIALQEELDWQCYALYGLEIGVPLCPPEHIAPTIPTHLPWCLRFAQRDAQYRTELAQGQTPSELPSDWFVRHGWEPVTQLPADLPETQRKLIQERIKRIEQNPALRLIESPNFKRRWYKPDYAAEEQEALSQWLAERIEQAAKERAKPFSIEQMAAALQDDPRVLSVCEVLTGRSDFSLKALVRDSVVADAVPNHPHHIYKESGWDKRKVWERTWEEQRRQDAGETIEPGVPPAYGSGDFLKTEYWQLRGKLDVPKERFIAFTEIPGRNEQNALYGWAGWTPIARIRAILAIDEDLENSGHGLADRAGLLDCAWRCLPDALREDSQVAGRLKAELQALVGLNGLSEAQMKAWKDKNPPPKGAGPKRAKAARKVEEEE